MGVTFELLPAAAFAGLRDPWHRLEEGVGTGIPFASHAFVAALLATAPSGSEQRVLCGWDGDRLVLGTVIGLRRDRLGLRTVMIGQTGDPVVDRFYLEHTDFLVADDRDGVREAALRFLIGTLGPVRLRALRAEAGLVAALRAVSPDEVSQVGKTRASWLCDLTGTGCTDDLIQRLGRKTRSRVRRAIRFHEQHGSLRIDRADTVGERETAFDALCRLHEAAWRARGTASTFLAPEILTLHRRFVQAERTNADLHSVYRGSELIGVLYSITAGSRAFSYQSGLIPVEHSHALPGFVAHMLAAGDYAARGYTAYVLMSGDHPHKERLATRSEPLLSLEHDPITWRRTTSRTIRAGRRAARRLSEMAPTFWKRSA